MNFIIKNIKWLMLVSGLLTATMFLGLFAPQMILESMFAVSFSGTLETLIIRSWSALIGIIGLILIYGFFKEDSRVFCITIAVLSKFIFVTLLLIYGQDYLNKTAGALIMDSLVILMALCYLISLRIIATK